MHPFTTRHPTPTAAERGSMAGLCRAAWLCSWTALLLTLCGATPAQDVMDLLDTPQPEQTQAGLDIPDEPTPQPRGVGYHEAVTAFHDKEVTYRLFVPARYETEQDALFPLLVLQNPGGRPNVKRYQGWAEAHGVIVVGINKVANGMAQHHKPRYQDGVFKDLDAIGVRVHPSLRFTIGMSGGSADGERFARRRPKDFAGIVLQGAGSPPRNAGTEHFCVAVLFGALDPIVDITKTLEHADAARERGQHVFVRIYPKLEHDWAPLEDQLAALTWMLRQSRLTHPALSDEERASYRDQMLTQMRADAKIEDPQARVTAAAEWMRVRALADTPEAQALAKAWVDDLLALAKQIDDPVQRHRFLMQSASDHQATIEAFREVVVWPISLAIDELMTHDDVRRDHELHVRFLENREAEWRAGRDVQKLGEVVAAYEALAADAGDSDWAARAEAEAAPLRAWLEKHAK